MMKKTIGKRIMNFFNRVDSAEQISQTIVESTKQELSEQRLKRAIRTGKPKVSENVTDRPNDSKSVILRRSLGILYLIRAFTPLIVIVVLAVAGVYLINELQTTLKPPIEELGTAVDELVTEANAAQREIKQVSQDLAGVGEAVGDFAELLNLFPEFPDHIAIPELDIPTVPIPLPKPSVKFSKINVGVTKVPYPSDITFSDYTFDMDIPAIPSVEVPVPGMGELNNQLDKAFQPITSIFSEIDNVIPDVNNLKSTLEKAADSATQIAGQTNVVLNSIIETIAQQKGRLLFTLLALLLLAANYYILPAIEYFRQGMLLLQSLPAPVAKNEVL